MGDETYQQDPLETFFNDINVRIRDLEDKQRVLRDRMLLTSESFVKERNKNFDEINEMKKTITELKEENKRMKALLIRLGEGIDMAARKEEVKILQNQFDLFRHG